MEFKILKENKCKKIFTYLFIFSMVISAVVLHNTRAKYRMTSSVNIANGT